jgi:DNA-binding CsgD family transcriptional regulator
MTAIAKSQLMIASLSKDKFVENCAQQEIDTDIETDQSEILWCLQFTEKIFPEFVIMLQNARKKTMAYVSENFTAVFGYPPHLAKQINSLDYFSLVHPDDVLPVAACYLAIVKDTAGKKMDADKRFAMHYRIRHAKGNYIYVKDEKMTMQSRNGRKIGLIKMSDVTASLNFPGVKLEYFKSQNSRFVKIDEYFPGNQKIKITARESEIIRLLKEGFKSQEIADRLSISINTLKNHKSRIFKKANVRNSRELLNFRHPKDLDATSQPGVRGF